MFDRFRIAWQLSGICRDVQFWRGVLPRLEALRGDLPQTAERMDVFASKLDALERVLASLEAMGGRIPQPEVLNALKERLGTLDSVVAKIETLASPVVVNVVSPQPKPRQILTETEAEVIERRNEWNRLKLLAKFCQLEGKAKEIEQEWQRIQQDEHDSFFAFQTFPKSDSELAYLYKKGIADGIRWCVKRFC